MRVAITGATGNVGSGVVSALVGRGEVEEVIGIARRRPSPPTGDITDRVRWVTADVATDDLMTPLRGVDAVVHLAWVVQPSHQPEELRRINVLGTRRVAAACALAGVRTLVVASSIGAYSPGPKDQPVDEHWPVGGVPTSWYSRQKAEVEGMLDAVEAAHPDLRVVRIRPSLVVSSRAASDIARWFLGRPLLALLRARPPVVPLPNGATLQFVHTDDVGEAFAQAVLQDVRGAFNIAADPVLGPDAIARAVGGRRVPVPTLLTRLGADLAWRSRLQPTSPDWVDLALASPIMDTTRARTELGWTPRMSADAALSELMDGLIRRAGAATPPLAPLGGGPVERVLPRPNTGDRGMSDPAGLGTREPSGRVR